MNAIDLKPYFAENPVVALDYNGSGRRFALVSGPSGMVVNDTTGILSWAAPRAVGLYTIAVRCTDCPDTSGANLGVYNSGFSLAIYGNATTGWGAGYRYDFNSKGLTALVATTATSATYEVMLVPMNAPAQAWRNPNTWSDLTTTSETLNSVAYNRAYSFAPAFAGGIDVSIGTWAIVIRNKATPSDVVVFLLVLTATNSSGVIATGSTPNQAPTIPAFSIPSATVGTAYSFQFPSATDPEGQTITYFLNGAIPSGMQWNGITRTLSGTPTTAQTQSFIYQASDGVNTTSAPAQNLTVGTTANNAPVLPDFTFPAAPVGLPYYFQLPNATDSDGPNALIYSLTGTLPTGLSYTDLNGFRTIRGTPRGAAGSVASLTWSVTDGVNTTSRTKPLTAQGCSDYRELTEFAGLTSQIIWEYVDNSNASEHIAPDGGWRVRRFQSLVEVHQRGSGSFDFLKVQNNTFAIGNRVTGGNNADFLVAGSPNPSLYPSEAGYLITSNPFGASNTAQTFNWVRVDSCGYIVEMGTYTVGAPVVVEKFYGFNFAAVPATTAPADGKVTLQNGRIKVTRDLNNGGVISEIRELINGIWTLNYVNNYDYGRQLPITFYSGPHPFNPAPTNTYYKPPAPHPFYQMGYNPLESGSWINQGGIIQTFGYEASTGTYYIKSQARNFPTANFVTGFIFERWFRIVGTNIVRNWYKITYNRANDSVPSATRYPAEPGETPILYGNLAAAWKSAFHNGSSVVQIDHRSTAADYPATLTGEPWMASVNDNNRGMGITGPDIWRIQGALHYNYNAGDVHETSGDAMYMTNLVSTNMNPTGTAYFMFDVVVGSIDEIRTAAALHPVAAPANNAPNWSFANSNQNFIAFNGLQNNESSTQGAMVIDLLKNNVEIQSRAALFRAQDAPTIYIRMKNESGTDNLAFGWRKPGDNDGMIASEINFTCPRNGQYNTIAIPVSNHFGWSGNISLVKIRLTIGNENDVSSFNQKLSFTYIGKNSPSV